MVQVHQICDQIQSAFRQSHKYTTLSFDKTTQAITHILYSQGFIQTYTKIPHASPGKYIPPHQLKLQLELKYRNGKPALTAFKPVSLPSRKVYASHQDLMFIASARDSGHLLKAHKLGQVTIVETVFGILEINDAIEKKVGGKVLCYAL